MGILVDLQRSFLTFRNPGQQVVVDPLNNIFYCVMHSFSIEFTFQFDPQSRVPLLPPASTRQAWQVGIVQNVLFERIHFEYADGSVFSRDFAQPALDSVSRAYQPFIHDPTYLAPARTINPQTRSVSYVSDPLVVPVRSIFYTSAGFGELLDPWHPSGVDLNNVLTVDYFDEPTFGARLRRGGSLITNAEHILAFQIWLVAKSSSQVHLLASIPVFSLVFWLTVPPAPGLLSIGTPPHRSGYYGQAGIARRVNRSGRVRPASVRIQSGSGGRTPVLQGQTAVERGRAWLRTNGLLP
jgi:hypothetical protein